MLSKNQYLTHKHSPTFDISYIYDSVCFPDATCEPLWVNNSVSGYIPLYGGCEKWAFCELGYEWDIGQFNYSTYCKENGQWSVHHHCYSKYFERLLT